MSKMIDYSLSDITKNFDNLRVPLSSKQRENLKKIYPYYGAQNIIDYVDGYLFDGEYILVAEDGENLKSQKSKICNLVDGKFWVNNHAHIIQGKEGNNTRYIYYYLNLINFKPFITGSAQPKLTKDNLNSIPLKIHDIKTQQRISTILFVMDSKIKLNNKINAELEAMIETLYGYWFVQFDFPDENGKPYKSSGGEMVWNEDLKKNVPYGWDAKKLEEIFEFKKGVEPGSAEYLNSPINEYCIKFFRVGDIEGESSVYIDSRNKKYSFVHEKDVVVTFDGSVGKVGIGLNGAISGGLRKVYDKYGKLDNSLVYFIFKDKRIIATIHKYATGSILLHASSSINHLKIAYKEKIYLQFQEIIQPIYNQIIKNRKENQKLVELRDFLLPMLMNGQIVIR